MTISMSGSPPPKKLAATRMMKRNGMASMRSTRRISTPSAQPPKNPAMTPTVTPRPTAMTIVTRPKATERRAPLTTSS